MLCCGGLRRTYINGRRGSGLMAVNEAEGMSISGMADEKADRL